MPRSWDLGWLAYAHKWQMLRNSKYLIQITKRQSWQQNRNWARHWNDILRPKSQMPHTHAPKSCHRCDCDAKVWVDRLGILLAGWLAQSMIMMMLMTKRRSSVARRLATLIINNREWSATTVDKNSIKTGQHPITKSACYSRKRPKPASQWYWYCEDRAGPLATTTKNIQKETSKKGKIRKCICIKVNQSQTSLKQT